MKFIDLYRNIMEDHAVTQEALPFSIRSKEFRKGTVLTDHGAIENRVYFINKGVIELSIESRDSEKVLDFFFPYEVVTCLTSFLLRTPSRVKMKALTDLKVEYFDRDEIDSNYARSLEVNKLGSDIGRAGIPEEGEKRNGPAEQNRGRTVCAAH